MREKSFGRTPLIVGIGGTLASGSHTEAALNCCLGAARRLGAETRLFGGEFLSRLPMFDPRQREPSPAQLELVTTIRAADGVIIATPGYHGSVSAPVKNALDTLELTAKDAAPYFDTRPVGAIVTAYGAQATGSALLALRTIAHALRGWPTPFGAGLIAPDLFDEDGACRSAKDAWALTTVAEQVVLFANMHTAWRQRAEASA